MNGEIMRYPISELEEAPDFGLAAIIVNYVNEHQFNGTVLVQNQGQVVHHESYGVADRSFDIPITNETHFKIASITKAFTAVLILQLYEKGELKLKDPVSNYFPDAGGESTERITIHHLLNHTSGLPNTDEVKTFEEAVANGLGIYQKPYTTGNLLANVFKGKLVQNPGEVFDYNNGEYVILGKLIEKLTGMPYEAALKQRVFEPLGLAESGLLYQSSIIKNLANTYFKADEAAAIINDLPVYIENWYAAGAMYSTTGDLLKFSNALFGYQLLKPDSLKRMLSPGFDEYGYGLWIRSIDIGGRQVRVAYRPGRIMGANTVLLRFLDEDLTIIILSNTNMSDTDAFAFLIGRTIIG